MLKSFFFRTRNGLRQHVVTDHNNKVLAWINICFGADQWPYWNFQEHFLFRHLKLKAQGPHWSWQFWRETCCRTKQSLISKFQLISELWPNFSNYSQSWDGTHCGVWCCHRSSVCMLKQWPTSGGPPPSFWQSNLRPGSWIGSVYNIANTLRKIVILA